MGIFSFFKNKEVQNTGVKEFADLRELEEKKWRITVNAHNNFIEGIKKDLEQIMSKGEYICLSGALWEDTRKKLDATKLRPFNYSPNYTIEESVKLNNLLKSRAEEAKKICDDFLKNIDVFKEKYENNKVSFENFAKSPSMFFVTQDLVNADDVKYYFAYETYPVYEYGGFLCIRALVTSTEDKCAYIENFYPSEDTIRPMTFEEFEKHFLMERIENQDFASEKDVVEYSNYLRNLFNNTMNRE